MSNINLGDLVEDITTGFVGIVVGEHKYIGTNETGYTVQPKSPDEIIYIQPININGNLLRIITKNAVKLNKLEVIK